MGRNRHQKTWLLSAEGDRSDRDRTSAFPLRTARYGNKQERRHDKIWNVLSHIFATNMAWTLYAERRFFRMLLLKNQSQKELITGDQPVINTYATGISNTEPPEKLEFYYPVSPKLAILISENVFSSSNEIILKRDEVDKYNLMIVEHSHSQIYATSEKVIRELNLCKEMET